MTTAGTGACALGLNRQKEAGHTCLLCCVKLRSLIWLAKEKNISEGKKKKAHTHIEMCLAANKPILQLVPIKLLIE